MECRKFQVTQVSAQLENVEGVNESGIRVYAKVQLAGHFRTKRRTGKVGNTRPVWSFSTFDFNILKFTERSADIKLLIRLCCCRGICYKRNMGQVSVSLKELFDHFMRLLPQADDQGTATVNYPVTKDGVDTGGEVIVSFKFGDPFVYTPQPIDWGQVCQKGAGLIRAGGKLRASLNSDAEAQTVIDCGLEIAAASFDIMIIVFGGDSTEGVFI